MHMAVSLQSVLFAISGALLHTAAALPSSQAVFQAVSPPRAVENGESSPPKHALGASADLILHLVTLIPVPAATAPFRQFHVGQPLTLPKTAKQCVVEILHRNFANSYYQPEIVDYM